MLLADSHRVQDLRVNCLLFKINQIHLFTNAGQGGLRAQLRKIGAHETVGVRRNVLKLHVRCQLHILSVNAQNLHTPVVVRHTNVQLPVKSTESTQCTIDGVGPVGGSDHNSLCSPLHAIHQSQELRHDSLLNLSLGFLTLRGNGIDFIDENNCRSILLRFFKCTPQIGLGLSSHLRHDFGTIDQEEKCAGLVGYGTGQQGLPRARRPEKKHAPGRLYSQGLEQCRMPKR
mmetsp:Transcript_34945/g.84411  ORF Transcript_34945/g.84411 Transcript_34945/m.84411 type:complete len:230 (-) Transcript_34945:756-1445(-)